MVSCCRWCSFRKTTFALSKLVSLSNRKRSGSFALFCAFRRDEVVGNAERSLRVYVYVYVYVYVGFEP